MIKLRDYSASGNGMSISIVELRYFRKRRNYNYIRRLDYFQKYGKADRANESKNTLIIKGFKKKKHSV